MDIMRTFYPHLPPEEAVERLHEQLEAAYSDLLGIIPDRFQPLLTTYYRCADAEALREWSNARVEQITATLYEELVDDPSSRDPDDTYLGPRAPCPLCGASGDSPYRHGYTIPEGLRRHLIGFGNMHQCPAMRASDALARNYYSARFQEAELREARAREAQREARRATETLYQCHPQDRPRLIDEARFDTPRDEQSLRWALERLAALGFEIHEDGRVRRVTRTWEEMSVFADPCSEGRIDLIVFRTADNTPRRRRRLDIASTHLLDGWRHDLEGKLSKRLERARAELHRYARR